jgi:hypothetical protein
MYQGLQLSPKESPPNYGANDTKNKPNGAPQAGMVDGRRYGVKGHEVWRRKEERPAPAQGGVPLAPVGGIHPQELAARLTDSAMIQRSTDSPQHVPHRNMDEPTGKEAAPNPYPRKVHITLSAGLLADLQTQCNSKASVTLLGRIQGKHPGLQALTAWAQETLHSSLVLLSLQANNVFEVTFDKPEGRLHALNLADLMCESAAIFFFSWHPHYDASAPNDTENLDYPVWMQVANLCQVLRGDKVLQEIGEQIGQVISIDNSEAYKAKLFGPRIRLLVKDIDDLPHTVVIPRLDGKGTIEHALEFSGLPNQCGRCRARDHQVRHCPKKELPNRSKQRPLYRRNGYPTKQNPTTPQRTLAGVTDSPNKNTEAMQQEAQDQQQTDAHLAGTSDLHTYEPRQGEEQQVEPASPAHISTQKSEEQQTPTPTDTPDDRELLPMIKEPITDPKPIPQQDTPSQEEETQEINTPQTKEKDSTPASPPNDELNFPKLPSRTGSPQAIPTPMDSTQFVWRPTHEQARRPGGDRGKGKQPIRTPDSAPLTRQGYRSGRLADDFWLALNTPQTPISQRKTLKVIPILLKTNKDESIDYLVNLKATTSKIVTQVHIAELLAGVPWTEFRVRQHVVNEVAHALYKILVFTNPSHNPLQQWKQGRWFANWEKDLEGNHSCTLYVGVFAQENRIKPRKGQVFGWHRIPEEIQNRIQAHTADGIERITEDQTHWCRMMQVEPATNNPAHKAANNHNRFAPLSEENNTVT